ncbi:MAG: hypothetical protein KF764_05700 [Labilithrix sp.]|nr:hypothetical protein [Labilithrix sp.]
MIALSPETTDLVDLLAGARALAHRARVRLESVEVDPLPSEAEVSEGDADFIACLLGIVALSKRFEMALDGWSPPPTLAAPASAARLSLRDLLR